MVREVREETGIEVEVTGLVGIYSNPDHVIEYTSNGEVRQEFSICFHARPIGGQLATSSESTEVRWVPVDELDGLDIPPSIRLRIHHGLDPNRTEPHIG
ncbi:putative NUDIX hydrolase [Carbonactinospora thermoautotrophica]|uniref:Putative NUDIX hydrolase n=1 Tax=Carbonactinospora thermoautotrophica TaxID=1469144 RepID=A0A132MM98_9ACTN|nr:putative NUDIX hydrolase [Carbonactinospora thermoautotrophica]